MINNVPHVCATGILPSRSRDTDLFFEPGFLTVSRGERLHVRTLDLYEAPERVPQFHEQTFLIGAFRRVRFRHVIWPGVRRQATRCSLGPAGAFSRRPPGQFCALEANIN